MKQNQVFHKLVVLVFMFGVLVVAANHSQAAEDADYAYINEYPVPAGYGAPEDIVAAENNHVWFTLQNGTKEVGELVVINAPSDYNFQFYDLLDDKKAAAIAFSDGFAWVTVPESNRLTRISSGGGMHHWSLPAGGNQAAGIAAAPNGELWIAAPGTNKILRFDPDSGSGEFTQYSYPFPDAGITEITVYNDDTVFFTAENYSRVVRLIPSSGTFTSIPLNDPILGSIGSPGQVAINNLNHLWVVVAERNWLGLFIPGTFTYWNWKAVGSTGVEPYGLALSQSGTVNLVWFTLPETGQVGHLGRNAEGDLLMRRHQVPSTGSVPRSITVDDANHGWIAVAGSNLIAEWAPPYNDTVTLPLVRDN